MIISSLATKRRARWWSGWSRTRRGFVYFFVKLQMFFSKPNTKRSKLVVDVVLERKDNVDDSKS
jgi:hypothetical protein